MRIGLCRISSFVAVFMCICALAGYPQAVPSQRHDVSKGSTRYLRDVVVEKDKTVDTLVVCSDPW